MRTVHRDELIEAVRAVLARSGFYVSRPLAMRGISFDIVARRDNRLLIVKILSNVDAFSKENAEEMNVLAEALGASPLLIGERSGSGDIDESIVYSRFGIPIISLTTLSDHLLEGVPPFIFAAPGGLYVKLDSELLKKIREEKNISLGTLAEIAGVSRRTIQMYESGMGAMVEVAIKLEDFLKLPIVTPLDPFTSQRKTDDKEKEKKEQPVADKYHKQDVFGQEIFNILSQMGFSIVTTSKCPFEALTKDRKMLILTGLGNDESKLLEKAMIVNDLSKVTERHSVIFIETVRTRKNIRGTPIIGRDELKKIKDSQDLCRLVDSRSEDDENCQC